MIVHLIDGTYELFRYFYGIRRMKKGDPPFGAVQGVLGLVLQMIETGAGIDAALWAQFHPLEEALTAMGVAVWPMVELEADDALASAAALAAANPAVEKVCVWTPDKDLAQCVVADRVVQVDRKSGKVRDAGGVREKFGVAPASIPDYLALVGDAADGYPGIAGIGPVTAARLLNRHGPIEQLPDEALSPDRRELALLFKNLATLRADADVVGDVDELRWRGPTSQLAAWAAGVGDERLAARADRVAASLS